jgi:hypothetical protein
VPENSSNVKKEKPPKSRGLDIWPNPPPPSFLDPRKIPVEYLDRLLVFLQGSLTLMKVSHVSVQLIAESAQADGDIVFRSSLLETVRLYTRS